MHNLQQLEHRFIIASLVLLCVTLSTLMGHRKVITAFSFFGFVVTAAVWGMYLGKLEVLLDLTK